jgi:hypothetical protein
MKYWCQLLFFIVILGCSMATDKQIVTRVSPGPKHVAWWNRIEFAPVHKEIRGVPVRELDSSWRLASELRKEAIPSELLFEWGTDIMQESGLSFSHHGDFNNDGVEDLVLVGVYQNKSNERGSFVLILSKDHKGRWQKSFLEYLGKPGFTALDNKAGQVRVWFCMECDYGVSLIWDTEAKKYLLKPFEFGD